MLGKNCSNVTKATIYVRLLDEGIDVWRPVHAEAIEGGAYRILDQPYDRDDEAWEFEPGETVICKLSKKSGNNVLTATKAFSKDKV